MRQEVQEFRPRRLPCHEEVAPNQTPLYHELYLTISSGHQDFSQSTEEIAALTEEEKKVHLQQLQEKLKEKRAKQSDLDKEETKRNEV
jgi:hypothetical protein